MARAWPLLILMPLLLPLASGQEPVQPSGVSLDGPESVTISIERPSDITLTVEHTGGPPAPFDQARTFRVEADGVPQGWSVALAPANMAIPPGGSQTVTATFTVTAGAQADKAEITITAILVPQGADGIPGVGEQVDPEAKDEITITAQRKETATRTIIEALDLWIWGVLLLLLVAVVAAAVLAVKARATVLSVVAEPQRLDVAPGKRATFRMRVHNLGRNEDSVLMRVTSVPPGWEASLNPDRLDLEPGEAGEVTVTIVPATEAESGTQPILVQAQSAQNPRRPVHASVDAVVSG